MQSRRTKRGKKRARPPAAEDFVKVVPVQLKDNDTQPMQVRSPECFTS